MKLKSIHIVNMHNVKDKTYDLHDIFTYFKGPNGAGKSTVLEAIQLVILGYIPGYSKTNDAIMKHSCGSVMEVSGVFDGLTITRRWMKKGSSVSSSVETVPEQTEVNLVDSKLELPIYNFNDFKDLTANKLKEWFISFLPAADAKMDWESILKECVEDVGRTAILDQDLIWETLKKIEELSKEFKGVELVQNLNTYFKSEQSFYKKEIDRLESTIQSLVHYDEELDSSETLNEELQKYMHLLSELSAYQGAYASYQRVKQQLDALNVDKTVTSIEEVEAIAELRNNDANLRASYNQIAGAKIEAENKLRQIEDEITKLAAIRGSICPYTRKDCAEIAAIVESNKARIAELKLQATPIEGTIDAKRKEMSDIERKLFDNTAALQKIETDYSSYFRLRDTLNSMVCAAKPTDLTKEEINAKIAEIQKSLSKVEANKRYDELIETITSDKYKAVNNLEIVKIWTKKTDANGLQTELMMKPFDDLKDGMGRYLTEMFGKPSSAHFNLSSKANSFSFGLMRDDNYIEFDYLSSGERCLFMLAMMICLLDRSNTAFRTILIDDLIDHLDDANAENVYNALSNIKDVQFILAGVKPCGAEGVVNI